jgi:hypothetical protein
MSHDQYDIDAKPASPDDAEAHSMRFTGSPVEQPETEAHSAHIGSPAGQPETETHMGHYGGSPVEQPETEAHMRHSASPVEQPETETHAAKTSAPKT